MDNDCIFCKIINGEMPADKIYEDDDFFAILNINPVNRGHSLVIPKVHFANIFDAPDEILTKIGPVIKKISQAVKTGVNAPALNIHVNNGEKAGQVIFHAHVHLIPRFDGDGFVHWPGQKDLSPTDFEEVKTQIIAEL